MHKVPSPNNVKSTVSGIQTKMTTHTRKQENGVLARVIIYWTDTSSIMDTDAEITDKDTETVTTTVSNILKMKQRHGWHEKDPK